MAEENKEEHEQMEDVDIEVTEFSLTDDEINEWLLALMKLKEEKGSIELEVDDETSLKINYEESKNEDVSSGEGKDDEKGDETIN